MQLWLTWLLLRVVQHSGPGFRPHAWKPGVHFSGLHFPSDTLLMSQMFLLQDSAERGGMFELCSCTTVLNSV